jgi:ATP-dependent protease ClpP protease subunit
MLRPTFSVCALGVYFGLALVNCQVAQAGDPCARGDLKLSPTARSDMVQFRWAGQIGSPMSERIAAELGKAKASVRSVVLILSSCGGDLREAEKVIETLRDAKKTRHLETRVDPGAMCGSACIPVFLQGTRRRAALTSAWLFHEVSRGRTRDRAKGIVDRAITERVFEDYFSAAGVSETWLNQLRVMVQHSDYWQTGQNLWESKSGIITDPIDNHVPRRTERLRY